MKVSLIDVVVDVIWASLDWFNWCVFCGLQSSNVLLVFYCKLSFYDNCFWVKKLLKVGKIEVFFSNNGFVFNETKS